MPKLLLRAALTGCVAAGAAVAQTPPRPVPTQPVPPPIAVPAPTPTLAAHMPPVAPGKMVLYTLDVADLVCPPADCPLAKPGTDPAMVAAAKAFTEVRAEELMKTIRTGTNRWCWDESGGAGKMAVTTDGKTLVVNNTLPVVRDVTTCVDLVRKVRSTQVKVDMVVIRVPSNNEAMAKLLGDKGHAAVSADEFNKVLRELKASGAADVLTRPTLLMLNKQTGFCQVVGEQVPVPAAGGTVMCAPTGLTTRVTPEVSADMKSVALALEFQSCEATRGPLPAINSQHVKSNLVLPDGGTVAVKVCTVKTEQRTENKVPVVSDLPYVGRLFRNVAVCTEPVDTVAVITATRVSEREVIGRPTTAAAWPAVPSMTPTVIPTPAPAPVMLPLPVAATRVVPPLMPTAPVAPAPVALPPATVYAQPVPPVHTVGPDGLERVGVNFNTLTTPSPLPVRPGAKVEARPGVWMYKFTAGEAAPVAGACIGTAVGLTCDADEATTLMAAYKAACAAGKKDEAAKLALQLLAKDPTCFGTK